MSPVSDGFTLQLSQGWNWTSHCLDMAIAPGDLSANATRIVGQNQEAYRTGKGMVGNLQSLEAGQLYKVQMTKADTYSSNAALCRPNLPIMLLPGWNWIGYTAAGTQALNEALADFTAEEDDQLIGQDGFATYSGGSWTGTLTSVEAGKGYMLYTKQAKTLSFHSPSLNVSMSRKGIKGKVAHSYGVDKYAHPNVMGIIGSLLWQGEPVEPGRFTLLAYTDGECRGAGKWVDDHVFLTTYGEGGETLQLMAVDELDGSVYTVCEQPMFSSGISGSPKVPVELNIGDVQPTGIDQTVLSAISSSAVEGYYSLSGVRVAHRAAALDKGAYIVKYQNGTVRKMYIK